jgi:hypothetical protein
MVKKSTLETRIEDKIAEINKLIRGTPTSHLSHMEYCRQVEILQELLHKK